MRRDEICLHRCSARYDMISEWVDPLSTIFYAMSSFCLFRLSFFVILRHRSSSSFLPYATCRCDKVDGIISLTDKRLIWTPDDWTITRVCLLSPSWSEAFESARRRRCSVRPQTSCICSLGKQTIWDVDEIQGIRGSRSDSSRVSTAFLSPPRLAFLLLRYPSQSLHRPLPGAVTTDVRGRTRSDVPVHVR